MPEIIETTVYQLHKLSDHANDKARTWYREGAFDHDWHDAVYADFESICAILGVTLRTNNVRLMGGGSRSEPCIFFRGFWSQGDGACFEGRYAHARHAAANIRQYAPIDTDLHGIADTLQAAWACPVTLFRGFTHERPVFRCRRVGRAASARPVGSHFRCRQCPASPSRTR